MRRAAVVPSGPGSKCASACAMRTVVMVFLRDAAGIRSGRRALMCSRSRRRALCRLALAPPGDPPICPAGRSAK